MYQVLPALPAKRLPALVCRLPLWLGCVGCLFTALARAQQAEPEDPARPARQNDRLRTYFLEQYNSLHGGERRRESPLFVDSVLDRRIDAFLDDIERRLTQIRELETEIEALRSRRAGPAVADPTLRKALRRLQDHLGDLRGILAPIFLELRSKSRFQPGLVSKGEGSSLGQGFDFLHRRIDEAEQHIRGYLFSAGTTVTVGALREGDMLVSLYEAAQMAKHLSREF